MSKTDKGDLVSRILVVDDEPLVSDYVSEFLKLKGFESVVCSDGYSALNKVIENPNFDLVIMDYNMPKMDGMELAIHLEALYPHIPKIMISGYEEKVSSYKDVFSVSFKFSQECNIKKYLQKPVELNHLLKTITTVKEKNKSNNFHSFEEKQNVIVYSHNKKFTNKIKKELLVEGYFVNNVSSSTYLNELINKKKVQNAIIDFGKKGFGSITEREEFNEKITKISKLIRKANKNTNIIGTGIEERFAEDIIQIQPYGSFPSENINLLKQKLKTSTDNFYEHQKDSISLNSFEFFENNYISNANIWFFLGGSATGKTTASFEVCKKLKKEYNIDAEVLYLYTNRKERPIEKKIKDELGKKYLDRHCIDNEVFELYKNNKEDFFYFSSKSKNDYLIPIKKLKKLLKKNKKVIINLTTRSAHSNLLIDQNNLFKKEGYNTVLFLSDIKRLYNRFINRENLTSQEIKDEKKIIKRLDKELNRYVRRINNYTVTLVNNLPFSPEVKINLHGVNKRLFEYNIDKGFKARSQYLTDLISK